MLKNLSFRSEDFQSVVGITTAFRLLHTPIGPKAPGHLIKSFFYSWDPQEGGAVLHIYRLFKISYVDVPE